MRPSVTAMQMMLDICSQEAQLLDFSFTSVALRSGPRYKYMCTPLVLNGSELAYVKQTKYLGIVLRSARVLKCVLESTIIKFYRCFNAMYYKAKNADTELVCVQLMKSTCPPVLLYAVEVSLLTKSDAAMLNHVIDRAMYRLIGCYSTEDIKLIRLAVDLP